MRTVVLLRTVVQRTDSDDPAARFAAEAAARRLPLKRQCCARSRADAEPRVYPRPYRLAALRLLSTTARRSGPLRRSAATPRSTFRRSAGGRAHAAPRRPPRPRPSLLPWRERHNGVPGAPPKPTSRRRLQPGPLSDTHFFVSRANGVPL